MNTVWISHPKLDGRRVEVPAQSLAHHQRAGWQLVDPPDTRPQTIQALIDGGWDREEAERSVMEAQPDPPPTTEQQTTEAPEDTSGASSLPETGSRVRRTTRGEQ